MLRELPLPRGAPAREKREAQIPSSGVHRADGNGRRQVHRNCDACSDDGQIPQAQGSQATLSLATSAVPVHSRSFASQHDQVHVLENNEGLLDRDFKQNEPFYSRFDIKSSFGPDGLADPDAKIVYCLKKHVNKHFLRKMVEGHLDGELKQIVLIVDEVDDLIVNERPNSHYVKEDVEQTPDLKICYERLKHGWTEQVEADPPENVDLNLWTRACSIVRFCEERIEEGVHYRKVMNDGGDEVIMLDERGHVPKVPLAAPWLQYINFKLCGRDPQAQTRYACVCTPYIFNKYAGIFGLTGSVGGKEELKYLTKT